MDDRRLARKLLGAELSRARHERGLLIRDVEASTSIHANSLTRIFKGEDARVSTYQKLAAFFGYELAFIKKEDDE